ncbi:MAG TPA: DUF1801 domain-containing protein [Caulobacter sp.]|nr:DUF1801 domain-containing protein [Caulobacter sp.]
MPTEPKTRPTDVPVADFIAAVEHPGRREDAGVIAALMAEVTGLDPVMWGPSIVGFGSYRGPTGDWPVIAFSPRKANLVLYIMKGFKESGDLLARLGKHRTGGGCLYLNRLDGVDMGVLRTLCAESVAWMREKYPS